MAKRRIVAIVGRPNVGKSTLFNRMVGSRQSIVHSKPGVTRDRSYGNVEFDDEVFEVVDTGGIGIDEVDPIMHHTRTQAEMAMDEASVIVFMVDAREGVTAADIELADLLRASGRPVILAANKCDNPEHDINITEFYELGLGEPMVVSASSGRGVTMLQEDIVDKLPEGGGEIEEIGIRIAIVGKPNVGKSSTINKLIAQDRLIVDDRPGTTRDSVDVRLRRDGKDYVVVDTAGMRRKGGVSQSIEHLSIRRALRAVRRCDVAVLMIDATEGPTEQDCKIAGYIKDEGKGVCIALNKWDLVDDREEAFKKAQDELARHLSFIKDVPFITTSALTGQRVVKIFPIIDRIYDESRIRIDTSELNKFLESAMLAHPVPTRRRRPGKIYYMTQVDIAPPTFAIFVNKKDNVHFSYINYLENCLREEYSFHGNPVRMLLRERGNSRKG
ncbi:ribosome biogenesis GTPase Der [Candidatus Hydrogenedentota bacterium]